MSSSVGALTWFDLPHLRRPLLLVAFEGLFDAASAATAALNWIRQRAEYEHQAGNSTGDSPESTNPAIVEADTTFPASAGGVDEVAVIDPEGFYNFQEARPTIRFDPDGSRVIDWPGAQVWAVRTAAHRDLVIMSGVEPHLRWVSFAEQVLEVARRSRCEMVVTVGAHVGMIPHSRPFSVTGSAAHPDLARRLNLSQPTYEGPTGVVGVINARLEQSNLPVISLRVEVPHYVPGAPNPKATQALLRRLEQTTGVATGYEELDADVSTWLARVDEAVAADEESRDYVTRLEAKIDGDDESLPSGDDLAAELELFLRDQAAIAEAVDADNVDPDSTDTDEQEASDRTPDDPQQPPSD